MSELLELAERCERAAGPDANLDEAIEKSLPCSRRFAENNPHAPKTQWNERGAQFHGARIGEYDDFEEYKSPRYTASLDVAITLVPEGDAVFWRVGNDGEGGNPGDFKAEILVAGLLASKHSTAVAETAPLALCAAALRARASTPHPTSRR